MTRHLVVDIGTSSIRASMLTDAAELLCEHHREFRPQTPDPGIVEFDAAEMGSIVLELCTAAIQQSGTPDVVGITNQRGSTVVWDRDSGEPIGPAHGWQDLRTVGDCLALQQSGLRLAPNMPATKVKWMLDTFDAHRSRNLALGTVDSWIAWVLSRGSLHVSDPSNTGVTGFWNEHGWEHEPLEILGIPEGMLPTIVDSTGICGDATALPGSPPIGTLIGDQQGSMIGQGCTARGSAKFTFGTGGMLDVCLGRTEPTFESRGPNGTFRIAAWRDLQGLAWGIEAIMLSAGTCLEWLQADMGLLETVADSDAMAASVGSTEGVTFVPALLGLGTPNWDYGARGMLAGATRGTTAAHIVRAVLEGVAHRAADMREAAVMDAGLPIDAIRVDGGMSDNASFVQMLADLCGVPVELSPVREATTLGASLLAGVAIGVDDAVEETAERWNPKRTVEPNCSESHRLAMRDQWIAARSRSEGWIEGLSAISF